MFLCSTAGRFFVPTCQYPDAARSPAGRRAGGATHCGVARPRLDGGEHGVKLAAVGLRPLLPRL